MDASLLKQTKRSQVGYFKHPTVALKTQPITQRHTPDVLLNHRNPQRDWSPGAFTRALGTRSVFKVTLLPGYIQ